MKLNTKTPIDQTAMAFLSELLMANIALPIDATIALTHLYQAANHGDALLINKEKFYKPKQYFKCLNLEFFCFTKAEVLIPFIDRKLCVPSIDLGTVFRVHNGDNQNITISKVGISYYRPVFMKEKLCHSIKQIIILIECANVEQAQEEMNKTVHNLLSKEITPTVLDIAGDSLAMAHTLATIGNVPIASLFLQETFELLESYRPSAPKISLNVIEKMQLNITGLLHEIRQNTAN